MWHDLETTNDLLNFQSLSKVAAELIKDSSNEPLSIGISGSWGSGKSSLVKMIGKELSEENTEYIFLEFNAWLYQGFDEAKIALLQSVSDKLLEKAETDEKLLEKVKKLVKKINWFKLIKLSAPVITGATIGGVTGGPIGAFIGSIGGLFSGNATPSQEQIQELHERYLEVEPELSDLIKGEDMTSLPKEVNSLRKNFQDILEELNIKLVVLIDDLDRCMPNTAISTLEAMRLLLFLPRTAFIIAADEKMIRNAVHAHFSAAQIDDELVTSYFDKLIQVPLQVPRLGINEVKAYLILLLTDLAVRKNTITKESYLAAKEKILKKLKQPWLGGLTHNDMYEAFNKDTKILKEIDIADQLAAIMATSNQLAGNPRLIKRFLNNLVIREKIAKSHEMSISFEELVKIQIFERCASTAAFEFLSKKVYESETGKPEFLPKLEKDLANGKDYDEPDVSWKDDFIQEWIQMKPSLKDIDLRPFLYLSRNINVSLIGIDELSLEAQGIFDALLKIKGFQNLLINKIKSLGEEEANKLLIRLKRRIPSEQESYLSVLRCYHIIKAYPSFSNTFIQILDELSSKKRPVSLIPLIAKDKWAKEVLERWEKDESTPKQVKNAINLKG
jgi:predicted KAP-like P-loop ATPase